MVAAPGDTMSRLNKHGTLHFDPRRPVKWFDPLVLARTGLQVILSSVFERFADKREIEGAIDAPLIDVSGSDEDFWIDYISDTGDGFDATATMAWMLAKDQLDVDGHTMPRGSLLVFGGDEVYPFASISEYENRLVGPYRAMFPHSDPPSPLVVAIPGNHDWYDGLTAFMHVFAQTRPEPTRHDQTRPVQDPVTSVAVESTSGRWIGGWITAQRRSYFAVQLPNRWWLWGIDVQLDTYIDNAQLAYFGEMAKQLHEGDGVILCCARPTWVHCGKSDPEAYSVLDFFERTIIRPTGANLRLTLTGDHHSYARYESDDGEHKLIAGGGGAFLDATHHFPTELNLPPPESNDRGKSPTRTFSLVESSLYPSAAQSRIEARKSARVLWRNGWRFLAMVAAFYGLWALTIPRPWDSSSIALWLGVALPF